MRKKFKKVVLLVLVLVVLIWIFRKAHLIPSLRQIFAPRAVIIDDTPVLIKEIRSIAELVTITSFDEVVADSTVLTRAAVAVNALNRFSPFPLLPAPQKRIVLIAKGQVLAGTRLSDLKEQDIIINEDSIYVNLPKAVVLDVIINPSGFETFDEQGSWTNDEVVAVKLRARHKLVQRALQLNILQKADVKAKSVIENFMKTAGYKYVVIKNRP